MAHLQTQFSWGLFMEVVYGGCLWRLFIEVVYGGCLWRLFMEAVHGGYLWRLFMEIVYGGCLWRLFMEIIYGGYSWSSIKGVTCHPGSGDRYTKVLGRVASRRKGFKVVERKVTAASNKKTKQKSHGRHASNTSQRQGSKTRVRTHV